MLLALVPIHSVLRLMQVSICISWQKLDLGTILTVPPSGNCPVMPRYCLFGRQVPKLLPEMRVDPTVEQTDEEFFNYLRQAMRPVGMLQTIARR